MKLVDVETLIAKVKPSSPKDKKDMVSIADVKKMFLEILNNAQEVPTSQISDGYHTFDDLYEQRLILSAALAKNDILLFLYIAKLYE